MAVGDTSWQYSVWHIMAIASAGSSVACGMASKSSWRHLNGVIMAAAKSAASLAAWHGGSSISKISERKRHQHGVAKIWHGGISSWHGENNVKITVAWHQRKENICETINRNENQKAYQRRRRRQQAYQQQRNSGEIEKKKRGGENGVKMAKSGINKAAWQWQRKA